MSKEQVFPLGQSAKGDLIETQALLVAAFDAFGDEHKCLDRCEHGGICSLPEGHDGMHDSDGYCQWEQVSEGECTCETDGYCGVCRG